MKNRTYQFKVDMDAKLYRRFCTFDTITRGHAWVRPSIFAGILLAFAIVCFCLNGILLAVVLAVVGVGLPAVYFGSFYQSVGKRIDTFKLNGGKKRHAYNVDIAAEGIVVATNTTTGLKFNWQDIYAAFRCGNVIYLYVDKTKAYILPEAALEDSLDDAWQLIAACAPQGKAIVRK